MKELKFPFILLIILLSQSFSHAQINFVGFGGSIGAGSIKGNSPSQSSFSGELLVDVVPSFVEDFSIRLGFIYARKMEYFLPEDRTNKYYPFIKAFTLKAFIRQEIGGIFFLEEGVGPLVLNDKTFSDTDVWNYGLAFNVLGGMDLRNKSLSGFTVGVGAEFGGTFNNTTASYYSIQLKGIYYFLL